MCPVRFEHPHDTTLARNGSEFFSTALGRALEGAEMELLRQMLDDSLGVRALLLGAGTDERLLDALQVQRRFVARIAKPSVAHRLPVSRTHVSVVDPCNLPFENSAFDVVILFHALDLAACPHRALSEAVRVLSDGGGLIITGFNPWSLWGLRRLFSRRCPPWNAHFLSVLRVKDWLSLFGFNITRTEFTRYRPLLRAGGVFDAKLLQNLKTLVRVPFGGVWLLKARHRALAGTQVLSRRSVPVRERLKVARRPAVPGAAHRLRAGKILKFEPRA